MVYILYLISILSIIIQGLGSYTKLVATWMHSTAREAEMNGLVTISMNWPPGNVVGYAISPFMNFEI